MRKLRFLLIGIVFFFSQPFTHAQVNLVPNPGFEQYDTCPNSFAQLRYTINWITPSLATPDYWNACDPGVANVPNCIKGFQPARSGNAFAGFILGRNSTLFPPINQYREYIQTELLQPLQAGQRYCVSFYINKADSCNWAVGNIGAYFSVNPDTNYLTSNFFSYSPQVSNNPANIIFNDTGWTNISGSFIAAGGERYLMIGNFKSYQATNTQFTGSCVYCGGEPDLAYYYIEDVCVSAGDCFYSCNASILPVTDSCLQRAIPFSITGDSCNNTVTWNFGDPGSGAANTSTAADASHIFSASGNYLVTAVVYAPCQTDTLRQWVNIVDCDSLDNECALEVPNIFTPNGDDISDRFTIDFPCPLTSFRISVYNRWGQQVFETIDENLFWDGMQDGTSVPEGVYFYTLSYSFQDLILNKKSGTITVLR
jgi:gliding motility-associated-like protein